MLGIVISIILFLLEFYRRDDVYLSETEWTETKSQCPQDAHITGLYTITISNTLIDTHPIAVAAFWLINFTSCSTGSFLSIMNFPPLRSIILYTSIDVYYLLPATLQIFDNPLCDFLPYLRDVYSHEPKIQSSCIPKLLSWCHTNY